MLQLVGLFNCLDHPDHPSHDAVFGWAVGGDFDPVPALKYVVQHDQVGYLGSLLWRSRVKEEAPLSNNGSS